MKRVEYGRRQPNIYFVGAFVANCVRCWVRVLDAVQSPLLQDWQRARAVRRSSAGFHLLVTEDSYRVPGLRACGE